MVAILTGSKCVERRRLSGRRIVDFAGLSAYGECAWRQLWHWYGCSVFFAQAGSWQIRNKRNSRRFFSKEPRHQFISLLRVYFCLVPRCLVCGGTAGISQSIGMGSLDRKIQLSGALDCRLRAVKTLAPLVTGKPRAGCPDGISVCPGHRVVDYSGADRCVAFAYGLRYVVCPVEIKATRILVGGVNVVWGIILRSIRHFATI